MAMVPPRCLKLYNGPSRSVTGDLRNPGSAPLATKVHAWLHEFPTIRPARRPGQLGRSEAEANLHRFGLDPGTTAASCEAIREPYHGCLGLAPPTRPRLLRKPHRGCDLLFVGAEGPKRLLAQSLSNTAWGEPMNQGEFTAGH